jgi:hypothetical protein
MHSPGVVVNPTSIFSNPTPGDCCRNWEELPLALQVQIKTPPIAIDIKIKRYSETMKISAVLALFTAGSAAAFAPSRGDLASTQLKAEMDRRQFAQIAFTAASGFAFMPSASNAVGARGADYVPKFDDLKQIYTLVSASLYFNLDCEVCFSCIYFPHAFNVWGRILG